MARNTTLARVLKLLKGELGVSHNSSVTAGNEELYYLIDNQQQWLIGEYDWPFLKTVADVAVPAGTTSASRYLTVPTTINFERPVEVEVFWNSYWHPLKRGIGSAEYNTLSSGDASETAVQQDPIQRWDWKPGDETLFEVWPLPSSAQTVRFTGQRLPTSLLTADEYDPTATLMLDDLLVVLYVAADYLSRRKKEDSKIKLAKAEQRLNRIRSSYPLKGEPIVLGGKPESRRIKTVSLVTTA